MVMAVTGERQTELEKTKQQHPPLQHHLLKPHVPVFSNRVLGVLGRLIISTSWFRTMGMYGCISTPDEEGEKKGETPGGAPVCTSNVTLQPQTHLHADLADGPGGVVADGDELWVQVGSEDWHELG